MERAAATVVPRDHAFIVRLTAGLSTVDDSRRECRSDIAGYGKQILRQTPKETAGRDRRYPPFIDSIL